MLSRFLILTGADHAMLQALSAKAGEGGGLGHSHMGDGFSIFVETQSDVLEILHPNAFVIGTLFPRYGPARRVTSGDSQAFADLSQPGLLTSLRDRYWGSYVALCVDGGAITLGRDASGAMPCYAIPIASGWAFASDVELFLKAGLLKPLIAWDEIPRYLAAKDLPSRITAICDVEEILPGTLMTLKDGTRQVSGFWSPWDYVGDHYRFDRTEIASRLRRTVDHNVASWASTTPNPLLTLSGGLDSSIVASALATSGRHFNCLTISTGTGLGDERLYARAMAHYAGADLIEADYDICDIDLSRSTARHFPKPFGHIHELALHATTMRAAASTGATAVYTGSGGDNVFYKTSSLRPLLDILKAKGPGLQAMKTFSSIAEVTGMPRWHVFIAALRSARTLIAPYQWRLNLDLLPADWQRHMVAHTPSHEWLRPQGRSWPGKVGHIAFLLRIQSHLEGYLRALHMPIIHPLMSQPIIELMLSVPSWRMVEGGRDRATARDAYANALPSLVLDRRVKGSPSSFVIDLLTVKQKEIRERLLDGELVARKYIDATALEAVLSQHPTKVRNYVRIMALLDMEAWIAHWRGL
jgi:asparagine synthase (glutamine-hydrolysing)